MIYVQEERSDNRGGNRQPHSSAREGIGLTFGCFMSRVVDPDPVGSASLCQIRIGIQGLPIHIRIYFSQTLTLMTLTIKIKQCSMALL
jgi:hypothetical protein